MFLSDYFSLVFELFRLVVRDERVNNWLQLAVHDLAELMQRQSDAVISYAILREVVGADFLAAIAAADHGFALFGQRLLLLLHLHFVEAGAQHAHPFFAVLDL